ncbi:hypothetical protein Slin15195_G114780 [Septoria linicola]|uniref:Secreted protein n=1 Tax=Septoria linicola TaxID=215465 RepID=A0A9Q9AZC0_9PEZI|nr:hypothetical protein Slin14017_G122760 [Septoria linicola]USW58159.1 hypothetical protein Slin15195_G114780 [Septoria linicola]
MKLLTTILALTAAALVSAWDSWAKDECKKWHPKAYDNINIFCAISNMEVPSAYASTGRYGQSSSRVWISPTPANSCRPAQWVPSSVCYRQFYHICANHQKTRFHGKNLCQMWRIQYGKGAVKPGISDKWPFKAIKVPIKRTFVSDDDDGDDAYGLVEEDGEDVFAPVAA